MNYSRANMLAEMGIEFDDDRLEQLDRIERDRLRQIDRDEHIEELRRFIAERRKKTKANGKNK